MNADGNAKDDVKVPDGDLGKQIVAEFEEGKDLIVTIISAMNEEQVCSVLSSSSPLPHLISLVGHLRQGGSKRRSMTQSLFSTRDICCERLLPPL